MSDHYETRCPSCGSSTEQGCYADCPTTVITALRAEVERLSGELADFRRFVKEQFGYEDALEKETKG